MHVYSHHAHANYVNRTNNTHIYKAQLQLEMLVSLSMINDVGFGNQENNVGELITCRKNLRAANQLDLKFVDDLTVAESMILKNSVTPVPLSDRPQPDSYHARTGHALIPEKSEVMAQIIL